jgi:hypothetical protein
VASEDINGRLFHGGSLLDSGLRRNDGAYFYRWNETDHPPRPPAQPRIPCRRVSRPHTVIPAQAKIPHRRAPLPHTVTPAQPRIPHPRVSLPHPVIPAQAGIPCRRTARNAAPARPSKHNWPCVQPSTPH